MKNFIVAVLYSLVAICVQAQTDKAKVASLVQSMTLEEKVGQMTQVTFAVIAEGGWSNTDGRVNAAALKRAVSDYKVGSMLNTASNALSLATWQTAITQIQDEANKTRLKIPVLYGLDAIHGQTYTLGSTLFPHNLAIAASRNPQLAASIAEVTAKELRASGVRWNFDPVLDVCRQPLWSRMPETFGEDVYLCTQMGAAAIKAYEKDGLKNPTAVASCMKHYLAYGASRSGKDRTPIYMPEIELREYYLPPFKEAVKAGASTIMINSSEINGEPVHASKYLLTDVLRKELGFDGLIVTDWEDIIRLHTRHNIAATPREAVVKAINAGIDMSMVPGDFSFYDLLIEAVGKGEVSMQRIDDAVSRILILKYKLGLFDNPYPEPAAAQNFGLPQYQQMALDAALQSMTLLQNKNNVLPLSKQSKLLVAGPAAQSLSTLNGCWSYIWQGNDERFYPADSKTILQALQEEFGASRVTTTTVKGFDAPENYDVAALQQKAGGADVIILCLGENAYAESPGNTGDLALDPKQEALAMAALATGKPVIVVLTEGRPRFITGIAEKAQGILLAYWSGKKTGEAIADVLSGDYNPAGKLPFSYHRSMGEIVLYDRKPTEEVREIFNDNVGTGYDPLFAFGHGLSYTTFAYSNLQLNDTLMRGKQPVGIAIVVTNSGQRDGDHIVELYTRDMYASITPNMKRLRKFTRIHLKAGESKTVKFTLNQEDLAFVNQSLQTITEPGDFELMIGDKKARFVYAEN